MRVEKIGLATLYLGDCREIVAGLERPAAVISDPPYGMRRNGDSRRFSGGRVECGRKPLRRVGKDWGAMVGDDQPFDPSPWIVTADAVVLWGGKSLRVALASGDHVGVG